MHESENMKEDVVKACPLLPVQGRIGCRVACPFIAVQQLWHSDGTDVLDALQHVRRMTQMDSAKKRKTKLIKSKQN